MEYSIDSIWSTPCGINIQIYGVLQENIDEGDHSILYFLCDSWSTPYGHYMEYSIWSSYGVLHMFIIWSTPYGSNFVHRGVLNFFQ